MNSKPFKEVNVGDRFGDLATITEWHVAEASALYYDAGPNHVNSEHSANNRFGGRIAHGFLTTGIMMGVTGRYYGWNIEAFLDAYTRFLAPVYVNENVHILWEVKAVEPKAAFGGGIVTLEGWCWAGSPERLAVAIEAKLALNNDESPPLHARPIGGSV